MNYGLFQELKDVDLINSVRVSFHLIEWSNELDPDPEIPYHSGIRLKEYSSPSQIREKHTKSIYT